MLLSQPSGRWSGIEASSRGLVWGKPALVASQPENYSLLRRDGIIKPSLTVEAIAPFAGRVAHRTFYKLVVRARESGEELWVRPFATQAQAALAWAQLLGVDLSQLPLQGHLELPGRLIEGELEYIWCLVETFNSTPGGSSWTAPTLVISPINCLVIGGGGQGGYPDTNATSGSGGGAGGLQDTTASVTGGSSYTLTIGAGGSGAALASNGTAGTATVFSSLSSGGGGGGGQSATNGTAGSATNGNGGGGRSSGGAGSGAGFRGGNATEGSGFATGGGGGASAQGQDVATATGGNGGAGANSSTAGTSVTYAGGGGGAIGFNSSGSAGTGGSGGGGGGAASTAVAGTAGTANLGAGGGGGASTSTAHSPAGGAGGAGFVALSYTLKGVIVAAFMSEDVCVQQITSVAYH